MAEKLTFQTYSITELSKEFEVTPRALRLYEESGLLAPKRDGNKRIYVERDRVRLRLLLRGKRLGCTLSEIKEIFDLYDSKTGEKRQLVHLLATMDERRKILETQRLDVELTLEEIRKVQGKATLALKEIEAAEKAAGKKA